MPGKGDAGGRGGAFVTIRKGPSRPVPVGSNHPPTGAGYVGDGRRLRDQPVCQRLGSPDATEIVVDLVEDQHQAQQLGPPPAPHRQLGRIGWVELPPAPHGPQLATETFTRNPSRPLDAAGTVNYP